MDNATRAQLIADLRLGVRGVSPGILREIACSRGPTDDLVEQALAEGLADYLQLKGWQVSQPGLASASTDTRQPRPEPTFPAARRPPGSG